MANFLRSFATGFISAANVQFDEKRKAQIAKDTEYAKLATKAFSSYNTSKATAATTKNNLAKSRAVLQPQITGAAPGGNLAAAMVFNGLLDEKQVPEFLQSIPPEMQERLAADPFTFTPGQTGIPDITTALKNAGVPDKNIQEFFKNIDIDPSQSPGQPAIAPGLTGGPQDFNITEAIPSPQEQRIKTLATTFVSKANMFASDQDFQQATLAFRRGDFETVIDLTARSPNIQDNIFLPILDKIRKSGIDSLTENDRVLLDLYRTRDPLEQMMNRILLQYQDEFESMMKELLAENKIRDLPPDDASDEENVDFMTDNIGTFMEWAGKRWDEIIRGRKQ